MSDPTENVHWRQRATVFNCSWNNSACGPDPESTLALMNVRFSPYPEFPRARSLCVREQACICGALQMSLMH
eukprot:CAMPEP_0169146406 /NCGR_PEP_ID=MMETSP1015-20121227/47545_1 /TAXON_ID=342587 /ORGANISM="Karlodinium micrum, Strain CCMP2283" /LENGTH=71 /DNA_ID=CAMNT_0009214295 /DNA_START=403 /DNA_END=618 /DNA_ORIENTATION=+